MGLSPPAGERGCFLSEQTLRVDRPQTKLGCGSNPGSLGGSAWGLGWDSAHLLMSWSGDWASLLGSPGPEMTRGTLVGMLGLLQTYGRGSPPLLLQLSKPLTTRLPKGISEAFEPQTRRTC